MKAQARPMPSTGITVVRRVEGGRLAYYGRAADSAFWSRRWADSFSPELYRRARSGDLGQLEEVMKRWLPNDGPILEAGCGLGQLVLALNARGYKTEGVELAEEAVSLALSACPGLAVSVGDVCSLSVPDSHYAGYISLGVLEHSREGGETILREAFRVLRPGGVALVSVPWFNALRRAKAVLGCYRGAAPELEFYQYAFADAEFMNIIRKAGFRIADVTGYDPIKGLRDEVGLIRYLFRMGSLGSRAESLIRCFLGRFPPLGNYVAHMLLVVARKPEVAKE